MARRLRRRVDKRREDTAIQLLLLGAAILLMLVLLGTSPWAAMVSPLRPFGILALVSVAFCSAAAQAKLQTNRGCMQ